MVNNYYIYIHIRKDKNIPFYLGKGRDKRAWFFYQRNSLWHRINKKHGTEVKILLKNLSEEEAFVKEKELINLYKKLGFLQANFTNGGEGASGRILSLESLKKLSESQKKRTNHKRGFRLSEETKIKISKAKKGCKLSKEHKEKIRKAKKWHKGLSKLTDSRLAKISESKLGKGNPMYGRTHSDEYKLKLSARMSNENPSRRVLINTKTGEVFSSIKEAANKIGLNVNTLRGYVNGHRPNKTDLRYKE